MDSNVPRLQPGCLVSIREVKAALQCCHSKAWGLVRDGHLTPIKFSKRMTRFRSDELLLLMERGV